MSARVVAVSGPLAGRMFQLGETSLTFGRSPDNAVVIASQRASRRHAEIRREGGAYVLVDLGSSNGTLLNGQLVQRQLLRTGDTFAIGDEVFRFEELAGAVLEPTLPVGSSPPSVSPPAAPGWSGQPQPPPAAPGWSGQPQPPPAAPGWSGQPQPPPAAPGWSRQPQPPPAAPGWSRQPQPPPPAAGGFQLPPVPPSALPPATQPRRFPIWLILVGVFTCIVLAVAVAGGVIFFNRGGSNGGGNNNSSGGGFNTSPIAQPTTPTRVPPPNAAEWTVLVYLDGDNNLESDAIDDFEEMARVGSTDQVHIVVQMDRIRSPEVWDDRRYGNWDSTLRFRVEAGMEPTRENALTDLGERNMGDPATLSDFLIWGIENYPAKRYAIILWDHGASWLGIASDDTDGDVLNLPEISSAFETAIARTRIGGFEMIGFDACLMAQFDVLHTVAPYGRVAVASAELEPNSGWAWDAWLEQVVAKPEQDGYAIGPVIVQTYMDSFRGQSADEVTLSAFDLTRMNELVSGLDALAQELQRGVQQSYTAIGQARSFTNVYAPSYAEEFNAIDLPHFLNLLPQQGATGAVRERAAQLLRAIESARLANGVGSYHRESGGLSIYFPQLANLYAEAYERASPTPRATAWEEFLTTYYQASSTVVQRPTIRDLAINRDVVSVNAPASLTGTLAGSDIAYVFQFIGIPNDRRDTVDLILVDFIYPPGAAPGSQVPNWSDGEFSLRLNWDATNWYLSNGNDSIEVLLGPIKYGFEFYGVEGIYTSTATGEQINAGLVFAIQGNEAQLLRVWGFPRTAGKQEPQPFELFPRAGDTFTAYYRSYTDTGSGLEANRFEGQTITFGDAPLKAVRGPTLSGDYVMGFLVRDIAGNYHYSYVDVAVDNTNVPTTPGGGVAPPAGAAQTGYQRYEGALSFAIDYPQNWRAFDTGNDRIIFSNRAVDDGVYVVVDVYKFVDDDPTVATRTLMAELKTVVNQQGELRVDVTDFQIAGLNGLKLEYTYPLDQGGNSYVVAVIVTSPNTLWTYLIMFEAPESGFDSQLELFNAMLSSLVIG
ncbi:clostripain-related cysteine peptidase [uncultured Chloroflexus sp.]|uniref:clostripain-related cysteine peptidase n=1 Tax=uncultured Chloroflexus sp. TaxID=214040 RepID=UPI00262BCEC9|nr:clostripain-related cysteine peptidase [uncultured Chloroflexus sp.]